MNSSKETTPPSASSPPASERPTPFVRNRDGTLDYGFLRLNPRREAKRIVMRTEGLSPRQYRRRRKELQREQAAREREANRE